MKRVLYKSTLPCTEVDAPRRIPHNLPVRTKRKYLPYGDVERFHSCSFNSQRAICDTFYNGDSVRFYPRPEYNWGELEAICKMLNARNETT